MGLQLLGIKRHAHTSVDGICVNAFGLDEVGQKIEIFGKERALDHFDHSLEKSWSLDS